MATRPRFDLRNIPRYLWHGPAAIRQTLAEQGPTLAGRAARLYSLALCLTFLVIYFLMFCVLGLFQIQPTVPGGGPDLSQPGVIVFLVVGGAVLIAAALVAVWSAALGIRALFMPEEQNGAAVGLMLWGIGLVIFYGGLVSGLMGNRP